MRFSSDKFTAAYRDEYTGEELPRDSATAAMQDELADANSIVWEWVPKDQIEANPKPPAQIRARWVVSNKVDRGSRRGLSPPRTSFCANFKRNAAALVRTSLSLTDAPDQRGAYPMGLVLAILRGMALSMEVRRALGTDAEEEYEKHAQHDHDQSGRRGCM